MLVHVENLEGNFAVKTLSCF